MSTVKELRDLASELGIPFTTKTRKAEFQDELFDIRLAYSVMSAILFIINAHRRSG